MTRKIFPSISIASLVCGGGRAHTDRGDDSLPPYEPHSSSTSSNSSESKSVKREAQGCTSKTIGEQDDDPIQSTLASLSSALWKISHSMLQHPELALHEYLTHDLVADFMESQKGWCVTRHAYGLETAVEAVWELGRGKDALPGIGHACGHNLICIVGIGSALATAAALKASNTPGKIHLLATPAEESIGGKKLLLSAGAFLPMDCCLMAHPGPYGGIAPSLATSNFEVDYWGKEAHAALQPWEGVNALDAAAGALGNLSALRQQVKPDCRLHGIIKSDESWAVNIIPAHSKVIYGVRAPTKNELEPLRARVLACFEAAAQSTGCTWEWKTIMDYADQRPNHALGAEFLRYWNGTFEEKLEFSSDAVASTDYGNVTYALPALHAHFSIPTVPGSGNHTPGFTKAAGTKEAHEQALKCSQALATTALKVFQDGEFMGDVKRTWEEDMKRAKDGLPANPGRS